MTRGQRRFLEELESWRQEFVEGQLKSFGIRQPKLAPGERFAKIPGVATSGSGEPLIRGAAHVTDQRVFIVQNRPVPVRERRWAEVEHVRILKTWEGVLIGSDPADIIVQREPPKRTTTVRWLKLLGAQALARGRFDAWLAELPALLGVQAPELAED